MTFGYCAIWSWILWLKDPHMSPFLQAWWLWPGTRFLFADIHLVMGSHSCFYSCSSLRLNLVRVYCLSLRLLYCARLLTASWYVRNCSSIWQCSYWRLFSVCGQLETICQWGWWTLFYAKELYIYIYIYIYPFTKTLLFQKYISYICITVEKRLKQGGHTSSVIPLWPLPSVFYICVFSDVDKKDTSAEKA